MSSFKTKLNADNSTELPNVEKISNVSWEDFYYAVKTPLDNTISNIFKNCVVQSQNQTYFQSEFDNVNNNFNIHTHSHPCHKITAKFEELSKSSEKIRRNELKFCLNQNIDNVDKFINCKKISMKNYLRDLQEYEAEILNSYLSKNI